MTHPTFSISKQILFAGVLLFVLIVGLEVGLRVLDVIRRAPETPYRLGMHFVPAPYVVHHAEPSFRSPELHTNDYGLRTTPFSLHPAPGVTRVVMTGGSAMFGFGASDDAHTIPRIVERLVAERFPDRQIEVINAGQGSYNSTQELIQYQTLLVNLHPDILVVMNGYNDFYHGLLSTRPAGFPPIWSDPNLEQKLKAVVSDHLTLADIRRPVAKLIYKSAITYHLLKWWQGRATKIQSSVEENKITDRPELVDVYVRNMRMLAALTAMDGVPMILALQPTIADRKILTPHEDDFFNKSGKKDLILQVQAYEARAVQEIADTDNVTQLHVGDAVASSSEQMFIDGVHFTDQGNARVAEAISDLLEKRFITTQH